MPDKKGKTSIKGLGRELYSNAIASAASKRPKQNIGDWMNEAMAAKLKKEGKK